MSSFSYVAPQTIDQVLAILEEQPEARLLGGGQEILLQANRKKIAGSVLVDLRGVQSLRGISVGPDDSVEIGAMCTLAEIEAHNLIRSEFPAFAEAIQLVGDAQLRNRATLGGSLASLDPESDLAAITLALDAQIRMSLPHATRNISVEDFGEGPPSTSCKVIASVSIPKLPKGSGMAYIKVRHPARLYAICGVAALVTVDRDRFKTVRLAVTGVGDRPSRLKAAEQALANGPATEDAIAAVSEGLLEQTGSRGDFFASAEYRHHLVRVLIKRALNQARLRAAA
jgi:carbon-monoxide dehydrogenase medium subunit